MIIAEAFASDDRAPIFSRIIFRARSTADRFDSASARLPPDFCWISRTVAKKFSSGSGIRSTIFFIPSSIDTPIDWSSTRRANSGPIGSGDSRAMIFRHSFSGRPDFTPRTMMSSALANSAVNFFCRPLQRMPRNQRGMPRPEPTPEASDTSSDWPK